MTKINLHIHTNYSDGFYKVSEIIKEAEKRNFDVIAITDHNEIEGALEAANFKSSIRVIPGIELFFLYHFKITELLVYFPSVNDITGFYLEFIGNKFLPIVKKPEELKNLLVKYNGVAILPHPKSFKGAIRNNFNFDTTYCETENALSKQTPFNGITSAFGGSDLHYDFDSLDCHTISQSTNFVKEFFEGNVATQATNEYKSTFQKTIKTRFFNTFLVIKYLARQFFTRKVIKINNKLFMDYKRASEEALSK